MDVNEGSPLSYNKGKVLKSFWDLSERGNYTNHKNEYFENERSEAEDESNDSKRNVNKYRTEQLD